MRAVTNISSVQMVRRRNSPFSNDPFFRDFFGDDEFFGGRARPEQSLGSGVIVSSDGYMVTNKHVIGDDVDKVTVMLPDKRVLPARIVGVDAVLGPRGAEGGRDGPDRAPVGRLLAAEGGPVGAGDRQPVPVQPDGDRSAS